MPPGRDSLHTRQIYPPINLKYIEKLLNMERYDVKFVDCWIESYALNELSEIILDWFPDILVMFTANYNYSWAKELIFLIKKKKGNILCVIIGADVTMYPEKYIYKGSVFDIGIRGESEEETVKLINELNMFNDTEKIINDYDKKIKLEPVIVHDPDSLPFPEYTREQIKSYTLFYPLPLSKRVKWGFVLSSRGCPHKCRFCSFAIRKTFGRKMRFRNPSKLVDEIGYLMSLGINAISFEDDDFVCNRNHAISICREIRMRKLKISWSCHAHLEELDYPLLTEMKSAGCVLLVIGIESGSIRLQRSLGKFKTPEKTLKNSYLLFKQIKEIGISTNALFMLCMPDENLDNVKQTMELAKKLSPDSIQLHFFTPYLDSEFYFQFKDKINTEHISKMYHYSFPIINLSGISDMVLRKMYFKFYQKFYFNFLFLFKHLAKYSLFYFLNPRITIKLLNIWRSLLKKKKNEDFIY